MAILKDFFYVYQAGGLFNHKDLLGNAALAESVFRISNGKFKCALPQNFENRQRSPRTIRDEDILNLLQCDLAVFSYDGTELDSGTVIEFMFAKFADIPAVILRTDFRGGGDCKGDDIDHPWNLMASFYPRTKVVLANSAQLYKKSMRDFMMDDSTSYSSAMSGVSAASKMIDAIAAEVVKNLDELLAEPPAMSQELRKNAYEWVTKLAGIESSDARERIMAALDRKIGKKLL